MDKDANIEIKSDIRKILKEIYSDVYCKFEEQYIVVFLCGGASNKNGKSLRDKIRPLLENEKRKYYWNKPYKIFYPEDLLIEVLNKTKDADLLSYEQFLANNSHIIVIICESAGSLIELGAFTNNEYTVDKVIASVDKKRTRDKSFIMLGPIKYLKKRNKFNVVEYGKDVEDFVNRLSKNIRDKNKINKENEKTNMINISTIVGMHYFIQLILYYFKTLNSKELVGMITYISEEEGINHKDFKILFNAALKLLFQDQQIVKITGQAMAFVPRKNGLKENAEYHKKNIFLLEMDITNFFGTITEKQVFKLFCNIGYGSKVAAVLTNLCTFEGVLPQGAVTSPYIANLVCYHLDARLNGYCSRKDIVYTRYADDLTFSSNNRILLNRAEKFVKYIVTEEGFGINEKKTRYLSNDVKKTVTGITINNEEVHVDKQFKRIIRSQIYNSIKTKNYDVNNQVQGKIAYVNSIESGYQDKIVSYIKTIIAKPEFSSDIEIVNAFNKNKLYSILPDMVFEEEMESPFD